MLRLGYLVPEFPGQTHIFFWREIRVFRELGDAVHLLSTQKPSPLACRHEFAAGAISETHYLYPPSASDIAAWVATGCRGLTQVRSYLRDLSPTDLKGKVRRGALVAAAVDLLNWARRERLDHIHGHSCADSAHVLALARRMGGPPFSLTLHGDLAVYGSDHAPKMRDAAFVSAVGGHLREQLEQIGVPAERIFVTCMGVDTTTLTSLGRDRSFTQGSLHLVTVARLNPVKGHAHAIVAIQRGLQRGLRLRYTIAGEGPHRSALLALIDELGLGSHVRLTGTLPENEVLKLLSEADAFLLPSVGHGEAWPVSVMEAMGTGLPVIASVIGATPEMISPGEDGLLVPQRDEEAILNNITLLANDVDKRRRIGEAARRTTERRFDVNATATALRNKILASLRN